MSIYESTFILIYLGVASFLLGTVMGSFLNCAAYRIAHGQSFLKGRSKCPSCGHPLGILDLIPIFSWLFLKGKCRYCGTKVSPRYLFTELLFGILTVFCLLKFDLTFLCLRNYIFLCCLFCLSLVDLESFIIPNGCVIIPILAWAACLPVSGMGWKDIGLSVLTGVLFGGGLLLFSLLLDKILKRESLGGGDVKLFFTVGLYLGIVGTMFALILACVLGLLFALVSRLIAKRKADGKEPEPETQTEPLKNAETGEEQKPEENAEAENENGRIPFGPAIAAATAIVLFLGQPVIDAYLSLLNL